MTRKVVALDFDGVLNHDAWHKRQSAWDRAAGVLNDRDDLDPECVSRLREITQRTGAQVVVSSTWRHTRTLRELSALLADVSVIGKTPNLFGAPRGLEIQAWMDTEGYTAQDIVILDDATDMEHLVVRLIQTDPKTGGLRHEHVELAVAMLGEK